MIKIAHVREITGIQLPKEVTVVIYETVTILDEAYEEDRMESGYGGYVLASAFLLFSSAFFCCTVRHFYYALYTRRSGLFLCLR